MKLIDIYAVASDGTTFSNVQTYAEWKSDNPGVFGVQVGDSARITKRSLLSFNTSGTVVGFDRSSSGKILVLLRWDPNAAPLRVGIEALQLQAPDKFWMVIPMREGSSTQSTRYDSDARRGGNSPAVHRFSSLERAQDYVTQEARVTGFSNYVILESIQFSAGNIRVSF